MMRFLLISLALVATACAQVGPYQHTDTILSNLKGGHRGDAFVDLGHNPDLGLTSSWGGTPPSYNEFIDTSATRAKWLSDWSTLRALDVGNSVATNVNQRFSGGTVQQWYVATDGNDTTGDGTSGTPWATLDHAYDQVPTTPSQNYQINIAAGTYLDAPTTLSGKTINTPYYVRIVGTGYPILALNQTTVTAAWDAAVADGFTNDGSPSWYYSGTHYSSVITVDDENIEIRGLRIIGSRNLLPNYLFSESGIWMQHASLAAGEKIIVADCEISQVGHTGIKPAGGTAGEVIIDGNFIHDVGLTQFDHGIYSSDGYQHLTRRNIIINSAGHCYRAGVSGNDSFTVSHNILIAGRSGFELGGKDHTFVHNVTFGNENDGLYLYRVGIDAIVKNNVFYEDLAVTNSNAYRYDTSGSTGAYLNRPPFAMDLDYNYVETGSGTSQLSMTLPDDVTPWAATTDFLKKRVLVTTASRYYEITDYVGGDLTGASEPTAESGWRTGITDGDLTLRYLGTSLTNNTYTNTTTGDDSASAVFGDAANYDFRFESGQGSVGTDLGYDNGTLVGVWTTTK